MPLNYSKWDMLELSDDSDIEEHPNVDKKSMIRWKQRDIHEKREARKLAIAKLRSELELNSVLRPRIAAVAQAAGSSDGTSKFRAVQRRLREQPSPEKPNTGAANQPTYDMMLEQLLKDVWREAAWLTEGRDIKDISKPGQSSEDLPGWAQEHLPAEGKRETVAGHLEARLKWHLGELDKRDDEVKAEIAKEEKEQAKKITSEGIRDGWSASSVNKSSQPSPIENRGLAEPKTKKDKEKEKKQTIEVLNAGAGATASGSSSKLDNDGDDTDTEDVNFGPLSASQRAFAQIALGDFEKSYAFLQKDSSVLTEQTHDSLLAEAFDAERRGEKKLAKQCVHQALLVSYCRQLGRDGVGLFFQRMIQRNPKSIGMFAQDLDATYARIATRTQEMIAEEGNTDDATGEREQIQLYAEDPNMTISFNLPDGPPPAELRIEGEGAEELDMEQVRAFLERKWEIFQGFPEGLRTALRSEKLDEVNKVLGRMKVAEAEAVVEAMQEGGMLSFSERGVRDMTAQDKA